jgi:hypothetical protein
MGSAWLGQSRILNHASFALLQSPKEPGSSARPSLPPWAFGRRLPMFSRSILLKTVFIGLVLATMTSVASATSPSDQSTQIATGIIRTYLTPDLTLKSYFPELPAANGPKLQSTCRCSCGSAPCTTDADCGGVVGSCAAAPSCCVKQPEAQLFQNSLEASRQTAAPAMDFKCK